LVSIKYFFINSLAFKVHFKVENTITFGIKKRFKGL